MTPYIFFVAVLFFSGVFATGQETIIPIVQGSYLLGGTQGGKWLKPDRVPLGPSPKFRSITNNASNGEIFFGRTSEKWDACFENRIVRFDDRDEPDSELPGLFIGEMAAWNLRPRGHRVS